MRQLAKYHVSDVETVEMEIIHAGLAEWVGQQMANVLYIEIDLS
jgi:hypothetical protein